MMMSAGYRDHDDAPGSAQSGSWEDFREDLSEAMHDTVAGRGREFVEAAKRQAAEYAASRKAGAARSVEEVANSLRESGRAFEETPHIRAFVDSAASGLEGLAADIRDRPVEDLYADAEDFARRHPVIIATGAGLAGVMIARFLKASAARRVARDRDARIRDAERRFARRRAATGGPAMRDPDPYTPGRGGGDAF
jgi:hypothetical protein